MASPVLAPKRGYTRIGSEAVARGTAAATMISFPVDTRTVEGRFDRSRPKYLNNSIHEVGTPIANRRAAQGDLTGPVLVDSIGHILKAIFGGDAVTGAGPYTHTFKVNTTTGTYTIEKNLGGLSGASQSQQFTNMVCHKATFTGRVEQNDAVLECTSSWMGKAPTLITPGAWTEPSETMIPAALSTFVYGPTPGVQTDDLLAEFQIDFTRDVAEVKGANATLDISDVVATIFRVTGFLDLYFLDWTKYNDMFAVTEEAVQVTTALSASKSVQFLLPRSFLVNFTPNEGQVFVKQRVPIVGIYDPAAGNLGAAKVALVNTQSAAY